MLFLFYDHDKFADEKEFKEFVNDLYESGREEPDVSFAEYFEDGFLDPDNYIYNSDTGEFAVADDYFRKLYSLK